MSDLAPEAPPTPAPAKGAASALQRKVGPFPLWLWLGIGGGVLILLVRGSSGTGGSATGGSTGSVDPSAGTAGDLGAGVGPLDLGAGSTVPDGINTGGFEDPPTGPLYVPPGTSPNPDPQPVVYSAADYLSPTGQTINNAPYASGDPYSGGAVIVSNPSNPSGEPGAGQGYAPIRRRSFGNQVLGTMLPHAGSALPV